MTTVRDLLREADLPRLEARMLLAHVLDVPRAWLIAHDTDTLTAEAQARFIVLARRRQAGEPMAYLLGVREFMGHQFLVTPAVLIPRPETELLVDHALRFLEGREAPRVLDLGTGSGALAVSIALACPAAQVFATDASEDALEVARRNASRLGCDVAFVRGDWYAALDALRPAGSFDLIVSNPPYIAMDDAHLEQGDLRFEPRAALTEEGDGLSALRVIVRGAGARLVPGGALCLEHGWNQAGAVRDLLHTAGFAGVRTVRDLAGTERMSCGLLGEPIHGHFVFR